MSTLKIRVTTQNQNKILLVQNQFKEIHIYLFQ